MITLSHSISTRQTAREGKLDAYSTSGQSPPQAALEYAAAGLAVFPLRDKRPVTRHGLKDASTDSETVARWWRRWPEANIGLRTGGGLVVIDVDYRNGGEVDPEWPSTRKATTRSRGVHLYYHCPEPVRCSAGRLGRGVDVRGEGGYVVAPPSPGWEWANDLKPTVVSAELFLGRGTPTRPGTKGAPPPGWTPFEPRDEVGEGERNDYLARVAGWLLRLGFDRDEMEVALIEHSLHVCHPPLDEGEVGRIAASIGRYER